MSAEERKMCLSLVAEAQKAGAKKVNACNILGVSIRTVERWEKSPEDRRKGPHTMPSNSLTVEEKNKVLAIANSAEYANLSPGQIVPKLADKGEYIASESSFYRILREKNLLAHRGKSQPRKNKKPEELLAYAPNEIWSWDITYLKAPIKGTYYYLYLPMDVFSRMIVSWELHEYESAELAAEMIEKACEKNGVRKDQLKLHSDNGGPMKGATMLATLERLGVAPSFSRPRVSDDNPYSESLFKTMKYRPSYPDGRFANLEEARNWVQKFVEWYNTIHFHSGINWVTPESRYHLKDQEILDNRRSVYEKAREENPSRWSKKTRNWSRIDMVELNPGRSVKENKMKLDKLAS